MRKFPQWIMAENRHVFVLPENQQDQQHHCLCKGDFHISGNSLEAAAATALRRAGDANQHQEKSQQVKNHGIV